MLLHGTFKCVMRLVKPNAVTDVGVRPDFEIDVEVITILVAKFYLFLSELFRRDRLETS